MLITVNQTKNIDLSKAAFIKLAFSALGSVGRFGEIIKQARASSDPDVIGTLEYYEAASVVERDQATIFMGYLVADTANDMTQTEAEAIINAWPTT